MQVKFHFYTPQHDTLGVIECDTKSEQYAALYESGYSPQTGPNELNANHCTIEGFYVLKYKDSYEGTTDQRDQWQAQYWEEEGQYEEK